MIGSQHIQVTDGTRLWVQNTGHGPTTLFLSGLGYSSWCWTEICDHIIAHNHRAVCVDNRGVGRSDMPRVNYTIERMADDAAEVLAALGISEATVVGHSMGGYIALQLALRHPAVVHSLVLVATTSGGAGCTPVPKTTLEAWHRAATLPPVDYARHTMPLSFAHDWPAHNANRYEQYLAARVEFPTASHVWQQQLKACQDHLSAGVAVDAIGARITIVHGDDDHIVPFANACHLASQANDANLVPMVGAGHLCFLEKPDQFADILTQHLGRNH